MSKQLEQPTSRGAGMAVYHDREGWPIEKEEWMDLFSNFDYCRVGLTQVGKVLVSTVWLGISLQRTEEPSRLFETMLFDSEYSHPTSMIDLEPAYYSTLSEAEAGHKKMVRLVEEGLSSVDEA